MIYTDASPPLSLYSERPFVLESLQEIAPHFIHPVLGQPIRHLYRQLRKKMPKFSETYSKWRSLGEGAAIAIILGLPDLFFKQIVPRLGYLLMGYFSCQTVWHLLTRWFLESPCRENIFITLAKLLVCCHPIRHSQE